MTFVPELTVKKQLALKTLGVVAATKVKSGANPTIESYVQRQRCKNSTTPW
jgi:hypothetical protein